MKSFIVVVVLLASLFITLPANASVQPIGGSHYITKAEYNDIANGQTRYHVEQVIFGGVTGFVNDTCSDGDQYKEYAGLWDGSEKWVWVHYNYSGGKYYVAGKGTLNLNFGVYCP